MLTEAVQDEQGSEEEGRGVYRHLICVQLLHCYKTALACTLEKL